MFTENSYVLIDFLIYFSGLPKLVLDGFVENEHDHCSDDGSEDYVDTNPVYCLKSFLILIYLIGDCSDT